MKKLLNILAVLVLLFVKTISAQCVPSCSVYATTSIVCAPVSVLGHNTVIASGLEGGQGNLDDSFSVPVPIGFTFTFFCNPYTHFLVSTNGFITFNLFAVLAGVNTGCCAGGTIPGLAAPNDYIAFHWNDLLFNFGGSVTYTTVGTAPNRQCIITFTNVPHYNQLSALNSGQIILFETSNNIEIHSVLVTADPDPNPSNGTQGIENSTGTNGYPAPGCNATTFSLSNVAYRWYTGTAPIAPATASGNSVICQGAMAAYQSATMPGASSYNWSLPSGWIGVSTSSVISATAGVSGNLSVTATYSCGTSAPTTISVTVIPSPTVSISTSTTFICSGQTLSINGTGNSVVNYTLLPLGLSGAPPFIVSPAMGTIYSLVGENAQGCVSNSSPTVFVSVKVSPTVQVNSGAICLGESFVMTPSGATNYFYSCTFNSVTPLSPGIQTYSVTGTTVTGCVSNTAICTVTVNIFPNVNVTTNLPVICMNESTSLIATGATTYNWINTASSANVLTVSPLSSTIYTVSGTALGCSNTATVLVTVNECVGLSELSTLTNKNVQIYPNPSNGEFVLFTSTNMSVYIYNVNGKIIYQQNFSEGKYKIDLNNFASGNYFLKATNGDEILNQVIIKQ